MSVLEIYRAVLRFPKSILIGIFCLSLLATWQLQYFIFDASPDTLVVQGDPKLATYLEMSELFGGDEFLVLTYAQPTREALFSEASLMQLDVLESELAALAGVQSVFSILDAPLAKSPPVELDAMAQNYKTLRSPDVNKVMAAQELIASPLFNNFLISSDGKASVIRIDLERESALEESRRRRDDGRVAYSEGQMTAVELELLEDSYRAARKEYVERRELLISQVRALRDQYNKKASLFISGVPMIAADMITFVKSDLLTFGSLVFGITVLLLYFFFRRWRWVVVPILISTVSILFTMGVLGFLQKPVTVVSSNFISLLAIISISFSIHLIVRYRELLANEPDIAHEVLVLHTMQSKFTPCLYTALTTLLAFGSMLASRIVPVEDFGWMMCLGIVLSFGITYAVFPAFLLTLGKARPSKTVNSRIGLTMLLSRYSRNKTKAVLLISLVLFLISLFGLTLVSFDNRFIDYFDKDTDIHKGMAYIDEHLGGTVPFDVYLKFQPFAAASEEDDFFTEPEAYPQRYWFTLDRIETIARLHAVVERQQNIGKVLSLATLENIAREFNDGVRLNAIELAYVIGELPETVRDQLILRYAKPEVGVARINARIKESGERFSRDLMIQNIENYARTELDLAEEDVVVTGMMVLFNDMLKQLAASQQQTLLYVLLATFLMFALLLRSLVLAVLALIPNVIAAASVIAFMGYAEIPLDMMTITIAAISIGIGVDDAIHYLHRFKEEVAKDHNVKEAVKRAHLTIGRAMYFTSVIITVGFSILTFSSFLPTVHFGVLTALAMMLALLANLTVLPSLLVQVYHTLGIKLRFVST